MSATTPLISANNWRGDGLPSYQSVTSEMAYNSMCDQWAIDLAIKSIFSGTIGSVSGAGPSTATLTLSGASTGPMWEGEVVGCATFSLTCAIPPGTYITSLLTGTWGASGSTYGLANPTSIPIGAIGSATAMANSVYYTAGPVIYAGAMNDSADVASNGVNGSDGYFAHPTFGLASASRIGRKWSADIYGGLTGNAARPALDRVKAHAGGCDSGALAGPCFDVGNTYAASASGAISGSTITITGGLAAHARPFAPGHGPLLRRMHRGARHHRCQPSADAMIGGRRRAGRPDLHRDRERQPRRLDDGDRDRRMLGDIGDRIELRRHRILAQHAGNLRNDGLSRDLRRE